MIPRKILNAVIVSQTRFIHIYSCVYAGHSKWANIKHIKAQKDGQKSTLFTKLARQIRLAVQDGGGKLFQCTTFLLVQSRLDPEFNGQLKNVIEEALKKNMPMSTIKNNIQKSQQIKSYIKKHHLEIRFKQKVFAVCILYTDNLAAFKMELAPILKKSGACYVDAGHLFNDFGLIETKLKNENLSLSDFGDKATKDAIECGVEDLEIADNENGNVNFICSPKELNSIRKSLEMRGYEIENSEHIYTPKKWINLTSEEKNEYEAFLKKIGDVSGMENIYDNVNVA